MASLGMDIGYAPLVYACRATQPGWETLQAPINKHGARFVLKQNSRKLVMKPDEMVPLWKILHLAGKSFGDSVAEDLRFVVRAVVGEENFIDMTPDRSNNYC